jgi:intein/homing endonuclease
MQYVGKPYRWGGDDPISGVDCCLAGSSLVLTVDGVKPIKDMVEGDKVLSIHDGKLVQNRVIGVHKNGVKPVFKIKTTSSTIFATDNHRFLALPKVEGKPGGWSTRRTLEWVETKDLYKNIVVVMGRNISIEDEYPEFNDSALLFFGAMIGDGSIAQDKNGFNLCLVGDKKLLLLEKYKEAVKSGFGYSNKITFHPSHGLKFNCYRTTHKLIAMGMFGKSCNRELPSWVWRLSNRQLGILLQGYLETDGSRYERDSGEKGYTVATASPLLANQWHQLLHSRRYLVSNICVNRRLRPIFINGKEVKDAKPLYYFTINDSEVPLTPASVKNAYERIGLDKSFVFSTIRKIEPAGETETFDLTIEGSHNYIANGFVVHNSGLALEFLIAAGVLPHGTDMTSANLCTHLKSIKGERTSIPKFGSMVFYGNPINHVGIALNPHIMIEAGGGDSSVVNLEAAAKKNAFVKVRPIDYRKGLNQIVHPPYPWE